MKTTNIYSELYSHNSWANQKLLERCRELDDAAIDQEIEIGFGTLRKIWFHILEAERIWLERWCGEPWRALKTEPEGQSLESIGHDLETTAKKREELIACEAESNFCRVVNFKDSEGMEWDFEIGDLLNHVANHGIHHRAQVLNIMRRNGQPTRGGVDYIFFKLAFPSCPQLAKGIEFGRQYGLELAVGDGNQVELDARRLQRYLRYNDWAAQVVFHSCRSLSEDQLDQPFEMGMGTLRKTLQHITDAERWWVANWQKDLSEFPRNETPRTLPEIIALYEETSRARFDYAQQLDAVESRRIVRATAGGSEYSYRVMESMLQLCGHATHHRAQCLNMLRQLGQPHRDIDFVFWLRGDGN